MQRYIVMEDRGHWRGESKIFSFDPPNGAKGHFLAEAACQDYMDRVDRPTEPPITLYLYLRDGSVAQYLIRVVTKPTFFAREIGVYNPESET